MSIFRALLSLLLVLLSVQACREENVDAGGRTAESGDIETMAGLGPTGFGNDGDGGLATSAKLGWVTGICVDNANSLYVTDGSANVIRKINASTGKISTIAGNGTSGYSGDGGLATAAQLDIPLAAAVDGTGNLLIVDGANNILRQVSVADGKITTIAGTRGQGYDGDGGPATAATFWNLYSVAVDATGNIYLADAGNNAIRRIEKSSGIITTIAGLGPNQAGYSGDGGPATAAKLNRPRGVAVDSNGNIYIADSNNNVIRKISGGVIATIAGNGSQGYAGDGGPATAATFFSVSGVSLDKEANVYISDSGSNVIRKLTVSNGKIATIAGNGNAGYSGDGGLATVAKISEPLGVAVDSDGNVYIADSQNACIRVVRK